MITINKKKLSTFKFGSKNLWRRQVWNEIYNRFNGDVKDKIVLYLAGEENLDEEVAIKKGFKKNNLIAVEKDKKICKHLRKNGVLTINSDINDLIINYSNNINIDFLFLDYCSGLNTDIARTIKILIGKEQFKNAIIAINLQRGRETGWLSEFGLNKNKYIENNFSMFKSLHKNYHNNKHRGILAYMEYIGMVNNGLFEISISHYGKPYLKSIFKENIFNDTEKYAKALNFLNKEYNVNIYKDEIISTIAMVSAMLNPKTYSYTSSVNMALKFDSIIFNSIGIALNSYGFKTIKESDYYKKTLEIYRKKTEIDFIKNNSKRKTKNIIDENINFNFINKAIKNEENDINLEYFINEYLKNKTKNQLSAIYAHRTMRSCLKGFDATSA